MKIVLLPQAQGDLLRVSEPLRGKIVARLRALRDFPEIGAPMTGPFSGYRSTVVALFRVVYRILPGARIEIAYIRDCRRAPPR